MNSPLSPAAASLVSYLPRGMYLRITPKQTLVEAPNAPQRFEIVGMDNGAVYREWSVADVATWSLMVAMGQLPIDGGGFMVPWHLALAPHKRVTITRVMV